MRKLILFTLLLVVCFSVSAQDIRDPRIFIPPIEGVGRPADNAYFYRQLSSEVVFLYYSLVRSERFSDYTLKAVIWPLIVSEEPAVVPTPVPRRPNPAPGTREFFSWEVNENILFFDPSADTVVVPEPDIPAEITNFTLVLELIDNYTGKNIGQQRLDFTTIDVQVRDLLSVLVYNLLSGLPDVDETYDWRENWFFLETSLLWSPRIYYRDNTHLINPDVPPIYNLENYGARAALELQFLSFMSFGIGLQIISDNFEISDTVQHNDVMLELPLAVKLVFKPANKIMIEPYCGLNYNFSLTNTTETSRAGWFYGMQLGIKAGAGMIVLDSRYMMDFQMSTLTVNNQNYDRNSAQVAFGYKIGFARKRSLLDY